MQEAVEAFDFLVHQVKVRSGLTREVLFISEIKRKIYIKVCLIESRIRYALCNNTFSKQNQFISLASFLSEKKRKGLPDGNKI